jgi:hypothetical protein
VVRHEDADAHRAGQCESDDDTDDGRAGHGLRRVAVAGVLERGGEAAAESGGPAATGIRFLGFARCFFPCSWMVPADLRVRGRMCGAGHSFGVVRISPEMAGVNGEPSETPSKHSWPKARRGSANELA